MANKRGINKTTIDRVMIDEMGYERKGDTYYKIGVSFHIDELKQGRFRDKIELINHIDSMVAPFNVNVESEQQFFLSPRLAEILTPEINRIDNNGTRFYCCSDNVFDTKELLASGTTIIKDGYADPNTFLEDWKVKMRLMGKDPDEYARYRADFGTIMHTLYGHMLIDNGIPTGRKELGQLIRNLDFRYISKSNLEKIISYDIEEMSRYMAAFHKCIRDYNITPLAIEKMLKSDKYKVATAVDLICEMDSKVKVANPPEYYKVNSGDNRKGDPKPQTYRTEIERVDAIWDFKSGNNFYDTHFLQLYLNKHIVEANYGDALNIKKLINFSPNEWKGSTPTYKIKDWLEIDSTADLIELSESIYTQGYIKHKHKIRTSKVEGFRNVELKASESVNYPDIFVEYNLSNYINQ